MEDKLKQVIRAFFTESSISPNIWKTVLESCEHVPSIYYLYNTVEFYTAYFSKSNSINLSVILYDHNNPVGLMPLICHQNDQGKWLLSANGIEIIEPIFIKSLPLKTKKSLELKLYHLIISLSNELNIKQCQFVNLEYHHLSSWYMLWVVKAKEVFSTHHLLVDLSLSIDEIRSKFRRRYKSLVNSGLKIWEVEVHESVSDELFDKFRLLHKEVAGRTTRSIKSWAIQKKQIDLGESFLVSVSDKNEELVGAGLFSYSDYQGFYAVGAYKRELFDKPIGHQVQMKAIEFLKQKKCLWYEIGQKHLEVDKLKPTHKELSITFFKEGFSNNAIARQHLLVEMKRAKDGW